MPSRPAHLDPLVRADKARPRMGLARSERDRELLARGWPNLKVLDPKPVRKPEAEAKKLLRAIDPILGPVWPRDVAIRWANAFLRGVDPFKSEPATLDAALASADVPDADLAKRYLVRSLSSFRLSFQDTDAVFVLEALLGADELARIYAQTIAEAPEDAWCFPNVVFPNPNLTAVTIAPAIGWVLLRGSDGAASEALTVIREARARVSADRRAGPLARSIDFLLGDAMPDVPTEWERRQRVAHVDDAFAKARASHPWCLWICDPQDAWMTGTTPPVHMLGRLGMEPRWLGDHLLRAWELLDHPFVAALRAAVVDRPKKLTKKQLDVEVEALFVRLVADLRAARGAPDDETAVVARAARDLATLRARSGNPMPEEHVGHILAVDGWDKKRKAPLQTFQPTRDETDRWFDAIASAFE